MRINPLTAGLRPTHPGELLREDILPALGRSKTEIAGLLGVSRQTLHDILAERQEVSAAMALRLAKLTGTSAEVWSRMQQAFELAKARAAMGDELDRIPTLRSAENAEPD